MEVTREVWKYVLPWTRGIHAITMQADAHILTAQKHQGVLTLWATVNPKYPDLNKLVRLRVVFTGESFNVFGNVYVATVQDEAGYVWHIYEVADYA